MPTKPRSIKNRRFNLFSHFRFKKIWSYPLITISQRHSILKVMIWIIMIAKVTKQITRIGLTHSKIGTLKHSKSLQETKKYPRRKFSRKKIERMIKETTMDRTMEYWVDNKNNRDLWKECEKCILQNWSLKIRLYGNRNGQSQFKSNLGGPFEINSCVSEKSKNIRWEFSLWETDIVQMHWDKYSQISLSTWKNH